MKRKLYVLSIPETELDLHLERWEVAKKYGFELPTAHFCSECHDWLSYTWIGSELRHDLPYSCPQQIIDECNNLCNTHSWLCEDYPSLKIEILYPYLVKWTHILKESGFDITGILSPGTTFAPDIICPVSSKYQEFDIFNTDRTFGKFFISKILRDAINSCHGVYFRDVEIEGANNSFGKYYSMHFDKRVYVGQSPYFLNKAYCFPDSMNSFCKKCGHPIWNHYSDRLYRAKASYYSKRAMFPSHLLDSSIDIFMEYSFWGDGLILSEKAYSIIKGYRIQESKVIPVDVVDDLVWFNDDYFLQFLNDE